MYKRQHFPDLAPYAIAAGAAEYAADTQKTYTVDSLLEALEQAASAPVVANYLPPLFESEEQYQEFQHRHGAVSYTHLHTILHYNIVKLPCNAKYQREVRPA